MNRAEVFLDSAFAIALANPQDEHHSAARLLLDTYLTPAARVVTTRAVMVEIGDSLSRARYRAAAVTLITDLEADPSIQVVPLSEALFEKAIALFSNRDDKDWGLTDCISFVVMGERGITEALTTDGHFRQAGFRTLLSTSSR